MSDNKSFSKQPSNPLSNPLSGYMELLPEEQKLFRDMLNTIQSVCQKNGYIEMDQPIVDRTDSLLANVSGDTQKELMHLQRPEDDERGQSLRFDLTVPLARYVANNYGQLVFPFRRYTIGKVFRGERPQAGRFREFYQCDVDIIGNETLSVQHDAEVILVIAELFTELDKKFKTGKFVIKVNNRKLLQGVLEGLQINNIRETLRVIDKKDKFASNKDFELALKEIGLTEFQVVSLTFTLKLACKELNDLDDICTGKLERIFLERLESDGGPHLETIKGAVNEIKNVAKILWTSKYRGEVEFDINIARGLDYYTGTVFETFLFNKHNNQLSDIGSVCSGGRYDDLASAYTNKRLPGVGMSIGLTRLFDQLLKKGVITPSTQVTQSQVAIAPMTQNFNLAFQVQEKLQQNGIACEILFSEQKFDKKMNYIDKLGIPYTVIIGEDEITQNKVMLKNMQSGEQELLTVRSLISMISK